MRGKRMLVGVFVLGVGTLAFWGLRRGAPTSPSGEVAAPGATACEATRNEAASASKQQQRARVAALKDAVRQHLHDLRHGAPAPAVATAAAPNEPHLGLGPEDLVPVPAEERPSAGDLAVFDEAAAQDRAHAPRPEPPDPDLLTGLLAAVEQATLNPALRSAIANSYLDAIRGLDEPDATEARQKLEQVYRPTRVH